MSEPLTNSPTPNSALLTAQDQDRIRAEERLRREIQAALAPPPRPKSLLEKTIALLNTNVGIGTMAALLVSAATWSYTTLDDHMHRDERKAAADTAKAVLDVQRVSPFLVMLAKTDSPERTLACRVLTHMITNGAIDKTLGVGLASEAGACVTEQARKEATAPASAELSSIAQTIRTVDRRAATEKLGLSPTAAEVAASNTVPVKANSAQAALARSLPRRLYVQYADGSQSPLAEQLRKLYQGKGWLVPAAEQVGAKAPKQMQVRYFNEADAEAAREMRDEISRQVPFSSLPMASETNFVKLNAPAGQIEVWLPQN